MRLSKPYEPRFPSGSDSVSADGDNQHGRLRIPPEALNPVALSSQQVRYLYGSGVADIKPNNFRREPFNKTSFPKIGVLRNKYKILFLAIAPDRIVVGTFKSDISHMTTLRIFDAKYTCEL